MKRVAIIGAGLSGLVLARELIDVADVTVFEKARGVGGRMATRREAGFAFDHGAQFFTARSRAFKHFLSPLREAGSVLPWQAHVLTFAEGTKPYKRDWFEPHFVAAPGMSSLCHGLAQGLPLECGQRITALLPIAGGWQLELESGELTGEFDWVISTQPAPQMLDLLGSHLGALPGEIQEPLREIIFEPCFALMLGFAEENRFGFDAARVRDPILDWISIDSSKPGRDRCHTMLLQATHEWSREHLEAEPATVESAMLAALARVLPRAIPAPVHVGLHRWRFASAPEPLGFDSVLELSSQLGFCGDWCVGNRVEAAFTSAMHMARQLRPQLVRS